MPNQNQEGLTLPTTIDPMGIRCVTLFVPDDPAYIKAVDGAILRIAQWQAWQLDSMKRGTQAAQRMAQTYRSMAWDTCIVADIYRINPDNGCQWQVSHDNGTTWVLFWDATACEPNTAHFLVDNPGAVRENGIFPAAGHFGIFITANAQTGIGINQDYDYPAADFYAAKITSRIEPALRLGISGFGHGFLDLKRGGYNREAIDEWGMYLAPPLTSLTPTASKKGGIFTLPDGLGYIVVSDGMGGYINQRIGDTIGGITSLSESYTHLADGSTPRLVLTAPGAGLVNIDLGLPTIPLPTVYNGDYTALLGGATPFIDMEVSIVEDSISVVADLNMPPLDLPTLFNADTTIDDGATADSLTVIVSETAHARSVDYILRRPPNQFDASIPTEGCAQFRMFVDGVGSWIPLLIPKGYTVQVLGVFGAWSNHADVGPLDRMTNGFHTYGSFPFPGDLVMRKTIGTPTLDGYYAELTTPIDPFSIFTATEDCWLVLLQYFVAGGEVSNTPVGNIYADIAICAPPAGWTLVLHWDTTGVTTSYNTQGPYTGSGSGGIECYFVRFTCTLRCASDTVIDKVIFDSTITDPYSGNTLDQRYDFRFTAAATYTTSPAHGSIIHEFDTSIIPGAGDQLTWLQHSLNTGDYPSNIYSTELNSVTLHGTGTIPTLV